MKEKLEPIEKLENGPQGTEENEPAALERNGRHGQWRWPQEGGAHSCCELQKQHGVLL